MCSHNELVSACPLGRFTVAYLILGLGWILRVLRKISVLSLNSL